MSSTLYPAFRLPNVEFLRKQAKDRRKLLLAGDPETLDWYRRPGSADAAPSLQKVQHLIAVDDGFQSWSELLRHTAPVSWPPELHSFVGADGRLKAWPVKRSRQLMFLELVAGRIKPEMVYTESRFNTVLNCYHSFNDPALLRRELLELGLIARNADGSDYRRH